MPNTAIRALFLTLAAGCGALAFHANAADATRRQFNIPAEDAAAALQEFARQSDHQLLFPYDSVSGHQAPAVVGEFSDDEVLDRLLAGSGLIVTSREGGTITLGAPAAARNADGPFEELIVTATKRPQSIRDIPISITAFTQNTLREFGALSTEDIVRHTPGLNFSSNGGNAGVYTIRGVSSSSAVGNTQSPVAIYIDDFNLLDPFYPKITTNLRLFDIDRVEVLRGPQGTLFGSGALGGAIRLVTNKPDAAQYSGAFEGTLEDTEHGELGYAFNAMANIPIVRDRLAVRIVGYEQLEGGFIDNKLRQQTDVNRVTSEGGRIELRLTPTDDLTLTGSYLYEKDRPDDSAYIRYGTHSLTFNSAVPNVFLNTNRIYNLTGEYDLQFAKLTSVTNIAERGESSQVDFTVRATGIFGTHTPSPIFDAGPSRTFSQEIRLASAEDSPFQWLVGALYLRNHRTIDEQIYIPGVSTVTGPRGYPTDTPFFSDARRRTIEMAMFGELSYTYDDITLTAGLRTFRNRLNLISDAQGFLNGGKTHIHASTEETASTPKVALSYKVSPDIGVYFQATKGYRVGQSNTGLAADPVSHQPIPGAYGPDQLWNYEIGAKTKFLDNRLAANAAAYQIDWSGIQLSQRTIPNGINFINNAGDARIRGLELEMTGRPLPNLDLGTAITVTDARLTRLNPGVTGRIGDRLPGSADFMISSYGRYDFAVLNDLPSYVRVDHQFVGREYADLNNRTALVYGNYSSWNLRAAIDFPSVEVAAFMNNVFDNRHYVSALTVSTIPVAIPQEPRTFGISASAEF